MISLGVVIIYPNTAYDIALWLFNIAMENGPFIDGLPIKHGCLPWLCWITRYYMIVQSESFQYLEDSHCLRIVHMEVSPILGDSQGLPMGFPKLHLSSVQNHVLSLVGLSVENRIFPFSVTFSIILLSIMVSKNHYQGTINQIRSSSISMVFSIINHPAIGVPIYGHLHIPSIPGKPMGLPTSPWHHGSINGHFQEQTVNKLGCPFAKLVVKLWFMVDITNMNELVFMGWI